MGAFQFSHVMSPACSPFICNFVEANQIKMDASLGETLSSSLKTVNKTAIGKGKYESDLITCPLPIKINIFVLLIYYWKIQFKLLAVFWNMVYHLITNLDQLITHMDQQKTNYQLDIAKRTTGLQNIVSG